jgi:ABC-2 type transport system permease protein
MVVLVFAANLEMKEIRFYSVDLDLSETSRKLRYEFSASPFFHDMGTGFNLSEGEEMLLKDNADLILVFNKGFEEKLRKENSGGVQLLINAINSTKAGLVNVYSEAIVRDFNRDIRMEWLGLNSLNPAENIDVSYTFWYNPELNYKIYMLPAILVILVTIIGMFLTAMNLVREKEMGTAEQINVTPIKKFHFIIGKLLPFWLIALFVLGFGMTIAKIFFQLPMLGSLLLLFSFAAVYLFVVLGIGLLLSTLADTQQQVMFLAFFFMLTFILMSGIFTPVQSMPMWAQKVNIINPFAYFMRVIRMILLKGSGFHDIQNEFISMAIYATGILGLAIWRYRKIN